MKTKHLWEAMKRTINPREYRVYVRLLQFLFYFAILYKVADAIIPRCHSDPLYYTLQAPKLFHFYGWDAMINDVVAALMTGVMELFTLLFFQFTENLGWIHILAQLTTLGCSLILGAFLIRRWTTDPLVGLLAGFSILTFSRSAAFFIYAKGDGVMGITAMIAAYAVYRRWKAWQVGLLIGLIPAIKMSGLYPAIVLGGMTIFLNRKNPKYFLVVGACAFAIFAPFLVRNYIGIGNPFFPGFLRQIPGRASRGLVEYLSQFFTVPPTLPFIKASLVDLFFGKIFFSLWVYFAYRKWRNRDTRRLSILFAGLGIYLVFIATNGLYQGARFFFSCFFVLGLFTFLELDELFRSEKPHFFKTKIGIAFLMALALIDSRLEAAPKMIFENFKEIVTMPMPEIIDRESARERGLWALLPKHPDGHKKIISETSSEGYYLDPLYRLEHPEVSLKSDFMMYCTETDVARLDEYDYFIIRMGVSNPCLDKIRKDGKLLGVFAPEKSEVYEKTW